MSSSGRVKLRYKKCLQVWGNAISVAASFIQLASCRFAIKYIQPNFFNDSFVQHAGLKRRHECRCAGFL